MTPTFDNSYARLPDRFFARRAPEVAPNPALVRVNLPLGEALGLSADWLKSDAALDAFSGRGVPEGAEPIAMAYAGHQFGNWVPQLGDGRAVLLGEVIAANGERFDLHLKGAGRTPFSRGGDGKAVLSAVLREYILSEAMAALGVRTTRALAAVTTGEQVYREGPEPGAVLCRVARGHIRVGTFQYFYARKDTEALEMLVDQSISRLVETTSGAEPAALTLLKRVMQDQADLVAHWMSLGFIHGVMNTDNMSITGETIDYGPCAFMEAFHPDQVFSSIDRQGRYAWGNQPRIAHWNLAQFAQTLLPLIDADTEKAAKIAQELLDGFGPLFEAAYKRRMNPKIGFAGDSEKGHFLMTRFLQLLADNRVDFTGAFTALGRVLAGADAGVLTGLFATAEDIETWLSDWRAEIAEAEALALMAASNPVYIPRNHRVAEALAAANVGDFEAFETLLAVLKSPYTARPEFVDFEAAAQPHEAVTQTFCGT